MKHRRRIKNDETHFQWLSQCYAFCHLITRLNNTFVLFLLCFFCFRLTTLLDVNRAIEFLAYLGYNYLFDNQLSAINGNTFCVDAFLQFKYDSGLTYFLEVHTYYI